MAGDAFKHVSRGDALRIPAAAWNRLMELARAPGSPGTPPGLGRRAAPRPPAYGCQIYVKNTEAYPVSRFGILGISDSLWDTVTQESSFVNTPALQGVTPAAAHLGKFVILQEPVAAGYVGYGLIDGVSIVKLVVNEGEEDYDFADIEEGSTDALRAAYLGSAQILWRESGTSPSGLWAIVRVGNLLSGTSGGADEGVAFKVTGNASGGGQYNLRILTGDSTADGSGNLALPEGMTVPGADNALGLNPLEDASAGHALASGQYGVGRAVGFTGAGRTIVLMDQMIPVSSTAYKVLTVNSSAVIVWDWVRAHG